MNPAIVILALSVGQGPPGDQGPQWRPAGQPAAPLVTAYQEPAQPVPDPSGAQPAPGGNGNGGDPCEEKNEGPEPWALMRVLKGTYFGCCMEKRGWSVSGWTEGNYTLGNRGPSNLPVAMNDRGDFWQMNQNWLRVDKAIDTSKKEFQWGGRTDWILPGTDARFTPSRNLFDGQTGDYRIDLFQAYVDAFLPGVGPQGTTFRVGKFATHCGYELVQAPDTPFVSRSYLFQYNPFTHTGVWAITPLNDTWTVSNGVALGSDNFFGAPSRPTYLGQLLWAPKGGDTSALFNVVLTNPTFDAGDNFAFYNYYNMVLVRKFGEKLTGVVDAAFSHMDGIPDVAGAAWWYGAAAYGIYKVNDKWSATLRNELFEDDKGVRTGFAGLYYEATFGLAWSPTRALLIRPGVRYDHNFDNRPWEGKKDLFTACMDVIVRW
jgi:hypothetical protein